ncbi:MAG: 16S rRNA (uracil(1498)-N(3))-methyltransferase [Gammaproteobacteria bacterium]|nr:16S rRNA (uracil(1498)-N(3))-methyltransferase [Gammaproteobacteria bacterium]
MRSLRIFHPEPLQVGSKVTLTESAAHHVGKVLRANVGDVISLFCDDGHDYLGQIVEVSKRTVCVKLTQHEKVNTESGLSLHLIQGICRGDKMDFILQKATELGVTRITPLICERTQGFREASRAHQKHDHWQQILISAAEQSGRAVIPHLDPVDTLPSFIQKPLSGQKWILAPHSTPLQRTQKISTAALLIGPEGGLSDLEVEHAERQGFEPLQLGPRILRTETASIAALAALQWEFGDFRL